MGGVKKRVPKRRFKEFLNSSDWDQRKLGDVSNIIVGGTPSTKVKAYWEPKEVPWMSSGEINKKRIYSTDNMISEYGLNNSNARWVKENSILIALAGQGKTRGTVAINDIPLTTNQSIAAMELNKDFDAEFIFQNLNSRYEELRRVSSGDGTRGGLNKEILSNFVVPYTSISEQVKIGNFFRTIDNLIIRCQCKLDKLQATKKALLQEMFPEEGQDKPKRRFKGFTDAWKQRKLSDILKVNSGKDYKHLDQGNIPVYGTGGYMLSVNESLSNIDAIGIGRKGTIDKPQYLKAPFWTVDTLFYLTALGQHSILFLYYLMQLIPWKKFDESTGVPSLSRTTIDSINAYVPSNSKEEELISVLFNQLDKSITLHQRKLDKLKNLKQAYLNEMFV